MSDQVKRRLDMPTRPVIFHRAEGWYPAMEYPDSGWSQLAEHAALNPGTLKITDAATGEVLWSAQ